YLTKNSVVHWGCDLAPRTGEMHFCAPQPNSRANKGQANEASEQQEEDGSHKLQATLFSSSSDILETGDRCEEVIEILLCTVGDQDKLSTNRIPFTIKSSTRINRQQPLDLVYRHALGNQEQKRKSQLDKENCTV